MPTLSTSFSLPRWLSAGTLALAMGLVAGCENYPATGNTVTTGTYEATATVTQTWRAEYARSFDRRQTIHMETFGSNSLVNRNGVRPEGAATGPDDNGLYWPPLPPRPTADELEARKREPIEQRSELGLHREVEYALTFDYNGQRRTLPTTRTVYREASRAFTDQQALEVTFGPGEQSIGAARAIASFDR
ncbi:hypothetical protein [Leptolyngbya sp. KIOST-1]|uniref:hypothetical protein n=1 Tax=Leptolyngbya sp. KIOST-1 TaxID=1229172 RepID=UPI0009077209|nr:hypothetical protein [Leptolyngbya sp. KIOST-1]